MALPSAPSCVITGAAHGIGRALAVELSRRRARLVLADVDVGAMQETARAAGQSGAEAVTIVRCDVTRVEDVQALGDRCSVPVHLVVNNAGVASVGKIGELSIEDWRWTLDVNLLGVVHGCHVFVPRLRAQGCGHVLNVASAAALLCPASLGAYSAAKAGVVAVSETLAEELRGSGVGVTVLCPTFVRTQIALRGRFSDPQGRVAAQRLVTGGKPAQWVARAALRSVERNELYALPMADGRWLWRSKRLAPAAYLAASGRLFQALEWLRGLRHR